MNPPNLPAVRLQLMADGDCTVHDAVDARLSPDSANAPDSDHQPMYWQHTLPPTLLPHFGRSLSLPTPSQLRNPHRNLDLATSSPFAPISPNASYCHEISLELADSLQSIIQTMLHVSPQQVLEPAREQLAACTLSVPTPCMSAMFTVMKNLNYISANMTALCAPFPDQESSILDVDIPHAEHVDFDIGELLQSAGDGLSGVAAQVGADLVLYHGDVGLKHIWVRGDEDALSYSLSHTIRQVLSTAQRGDTIELGLFAAPAQINVSQEKPSVHASASSSLTSEPNDVVHVTLVISHKFSTIDSAEDQARPRPVFSTMVLRRVLGQIGAKLVSDLPPPPYFTSGRSCELRLTLARGKSSPPTHAKMETDADLVAAEPSLEQLSTFAESLKGKRVALYASSKGSFAQHFTSYLTTWGMDVNHVSPEGNVEDVTAATDMPKSSEPQDAADTSPSKDDMSSQVLAPTRFIVIDDDVNILKERLYSLRNDQSPISTRRPSLANIHRPQSSPPGARTIPLPFPIPSPVVVLHFADLSNYKAAKDALQTIIASYTKLNVSAPEVMIIPKPAGPRRLLTALYTAMTKPIIDPLFLPIATTPQSPGIFAHGAFIGSYASGNAVAGHRLPSRAVIPRLNGGKTNMDRSTRSSTTTDHSSPHPPSPLGASDSVEYFSQAARRLGGSPSSGLVIQSPDGQPTGIFFHPRVRSSSRAPSTHSMERDKGERKPSATRVAANPTDKSSLTPQPQPIPAPAARAASTGVLPTSQGKPIIRSHSGPGPEQASTSSSTNEIQSPSPVVSTKADSMQVLVKAASSPDSTTPRPTPTPTRRSAPKRRATDSDLAANAEASSTNAKSAGKKNGVTPENIIVPPISVLIVDDNPINQTILTTFMKRKKIQYDIASNGLEAVEKWKTGVFHLILMDIQMPVMDGIEATKEIRRMEKDAAQALYPSTPTPSADSGLSPARTPSELLSPESRTLNSPYHPSVIIVALTASSLQSDRVAALGAGCNDFLTKPVSLLWLNSKIIEWGSIKALQMWADLRPNVMRSISHGQQAQARSIAERLHVPKTRKNASPQAQTSETATAAVQPSRAGLSASNDQTQNATGQVRDETRPADNISTTRTWDESQALSNKAGVRQGKPNVASGAGDDDDSDTPKAPNQAMSSFPSTNKASKSDRSPRGSLESVQGGVVKLPSTHRHNSCSPNTFSVDETTNRQPDVSPSHVS